MFFPAVLPARFHQSGGVTWLVEPASFSQWSLGGLLVLVSVAACVEAFRRGSRPDKVITCVAAVFTVGLIRSLCELLVLPVGGPK
jgi:hypothetical protein